MHSHAIKWGVVKLSSVSRPTVDAVVRYEGFPLTLVRYVAFNVSAAFQQSIASTVHFRVLIWTHRGLIISERSPVSRVSLAVRGS